MSDLTGAQKASFIDALLSGYTSDEQLAELLDLHLDVKLAEIAEDGTLREQVFTVVTWAVANGRTKELALQAQAFRPRNAKLATLVDTLYPGERLQPAASDTGGRSDRGESGRGDAKRSDAAGADRAPSNRRGLIFGAVSVVAILIVVFAFALRSRIGPDDGGNGGGGNGGGGAAGKDRPRLPATMRFIELSGTVDRQKVVIDARFPPPQLAPGAALWFVVGSGPRCRERIHRAQVDNPALGYMTSVIRAERARPTCAQLFVEDANGQAIARSDPSDITFPAR